MSNKINKRFKLWNVLIESKKYGWNTSLDQQGYIPLKMEEGVFKKVINL